jgi:hypothetical protein
MGSGDSILAAAAFVRLVWRDRESSRRVRRGDGALAENRFDDSARSVRRLLESVCAATSAAHGSEDAARSRLCSLPAHGFGACSRHRPFWTAMFGQPGAPQTLAARRTSTSSAAGRAVRRTREPRSPGRGRPPRPTPRRRRRRRSGTPASRARWRSARGRAQRRSDVPTDAFDEVREHVTGEVGPAEFRGTALLEGAYVRETSSRGRSSPIVTPSRRVVAVVCHGPVVTQIRGTDPRKPPDSAPGTARRDSRFINLESPAHRWKSDPARTRLNHPGPAGLAMRWRGLEPPRAAKPTRPSTLRVYQFRHQRARSSVATPIGGAGTAERCSHRRARRPRSSAW